jgi:uncharacterized protein involved in cysteine biosynthesis
MASSFNPSPAQVLDARPPPGSRGVLARFGEGFRVPAEGLAYMARHPRLWRLAVVPVLLNMLITGLVILLLVGGVLWFARAMHPRFPPGAWGVVLEVAAVVAAVAVAGLLALGTWVLLNGVLCGHFYTKLAREVELQLGTPAGHMGDVPFAYQVADTFRDVAALLAVNVGLLALNVVPLVGSVIGLVLTLYFDAFIFGRDYLDFPMSLRGMRRADKLAACRARRAETVGLGAAVFLLSLVPVVGSVGLATAATGSVLMYQRWRDADAAPDASSPALGGSRPDPE